MVARFDDVPRAIAYLIRCVHENAGADPIEVSFHPKQTLPRRMTVSLEDVPHTLEKYCRRFFAATVAYQVHHSLGFIAVIQCRCNHDVRAVCPCHCRHHFERPVVTLLSCPEGIERKDEDRKQAEALCQAMIVDDIRTGHDKTSRPKLRA